MLKIDGDLLLECKTAIENDRSLKGLFEELKNVKKDKDQGLLLQEILCYVQPSFDKWAYFQIEHSFDNYLSCFNNTIKNAIEVILFKSKLYSLPLTLHMEVTTKCNISCIMCGRLFMSTDSSSAYRKKEIKYEDMRLDVFERIKDILPYINILPLVGWGEPFVNPCFYEMLNKSREFGTGVNFTTNGMNLDNEDFLRAIYVNRNIFSINISFDGATEHTFNSIRRGAQYRKVIDNIVRINDLKEKYALKLPKLYFSFVAMKRNIEELCPLIDLAAKLNISAINVTYLTVHGKTIMNESLFYHKDLANMVFRKAKQKAHEMGICLTLPEYFNDENKEKIEKNKSGLLCDYPWRFAMIKVNGDVMPCCAYEEPFGNVYKEDFTKIWNNKKFQSLRKALKCGNIPAFCKSCNRFGDVNDESSHIHLV